MNATPGLICSSQRQILTGRDFNLWCRLDWLFVVLFQFAVAVELASVIELSFTHIACFWFPVVVFWFPAVVLWLSIPIVVLLTGDTTRRNTRGYAITFLLRIITTRWLISVGIIVTFASSKRRWFSRLIELHEPLLLVEVFEKEGHSAT